MKTRLNWLLAVAVLSWIARCSAAETDGVALAIIYDTSGSMHEAVRDRDGHPTPKFIIANRALKAIVHQIQGYATNSADGSSRKVEAGLFIFAGKGASEAVKFGPFDPAAMEQWADHFASPAGGTPLGTALETASRAVLKSPLSRKHVLVITDGVNTVGPDPAAVLPRLNREIESQHATLSVHFVGFDVNAAVFAPVKKLGATVVGAADERQLDTQLNFILQNQILLEREDPKK